MKLADREYVVTAWGEKARGPGWSNRPLWVLIGNPATGEYRLECLQPEEQTEAMRVAFPFSALAAETMTRMVNATVMREISP